MKFPYRHQHCSDLFARLSRAELISAIAANHWRLPDEYMDFLEEHNGMEFSGEVRGRVLAYQYAMNRAIDGPCGFRMQFKKWPRKRVHVDYCGFIDTLFGVSRGDAPFDIVVQQKWGLFSECVPDNFIAIGGASDASFVVLCLRGEWEGKVFRWTPSSDPDSPDERKSLSRLHFVADSFLEFWDNLAEISASAVIVD